MEGFARLAGSKSRGEAIMPIKPRIVELVDKGMAGEGLEESEIAELLAENPYSAEGAHIRWGGWMLSRKASNGVAESKYGFLAVGWQMLEGPSQGWRL